MAYTKTTWVDRSVEKPRTYIEVVNGDGTKTFTPSEGTIYAAGTQFSAVRMNNIETGLYLTNNTFTTAGSANAYTVTISGISAQTDLLGIPLKIKTNFAITGACTINVNSYGAYAIRKDVSTAMVSGDILSGQIITVVWDGTYYQFMGECAGTVTTGATQTLTNKTLTSPRISSASSIGDTNGNELIKFPATVASAVNEITISNAAAGSDPSIAATGADTNIDLNLVSKGSGVVQANGVEIAIKNDYVRLPGYGATTGTANTYTITLSPAPSAYVDGMGIMVKINVNNTGASTINVNSLGAKTILDSKGNALTAGKLKSGIIYSMKYNLTSSNFILQGEGGSGDATAWDVVYGKNCSVDSGDIVGALVDRPTETPIENYWVGTGASGFGLYIGVPLGAYRNNDPWYNGHVVFANEQNIIPANLPANLTIFGITGTGTNAKRYAVGSVTSNTNIINFTNDSGGSYGLQYVTISGLNFTPRKITVRNAAPATATTTEYTSIGYTTNSKILVAGNYNVMTPLLFVLTGNAYVNGTGFQLPVYAPNGAISMVWEAWE